MRYSLKLVHNIGEENLPHITFTGYARVSWKYFVFPFDTIKNKNFNKENLHQYRSKKVSKGKRNIRKQHYKYQPNDIVVFEGQKYKIRGSHCKGSRVILDTKKSVSVKKIHILKHCSGIC